MNVDSNIISLFQTIKSDMPKYLKSAMIASSKKLLGDMKLALRKGNVYGTPLPALSSQRKILKSKSKYKNMGGKFIDMLRTTGGDNGIVVGFVKDTPKLHDFLGGGTSKWIQWRNIDMAKRKKKPPFLKPGSYPLPGRPFIDLIANNPQVKANIEMAAFNRVKQLIGLAQSKKPSRYT